ncbi:MAG: cytochrome c [Desulfobulbaceae bacterium]|nr:cytochrome c [Desulfobulbaceae bacterium]
MKTILCLFPVLLFLFLDKPSLGHSWMAPEDAAKRKNPAPVSTESVQHGEALFTELCASCHGIKGAGFSKEKTGLRVDTPNLPSNLQTHSDGDFHWKIVNGNDDMPSFEDHLSEKEIWNIINYIRSLIDDPNS